MKDLVKKYYAENAVEEWKRLIRDPYHQLEFITTMHFLKKYLPEKGLILDAGGGPGRYTIELAKLGYDIVLLDLTPELLEIAKEQIKKENLQAKVKQIIEGSIEDLSIFKDNTFDAVICLGGVLSHILEKKDRLRAILELKRVAKNGAPIFISVIGRMHLPIGWLFLWGEEGHKEFLEGYVDEIMETGDYYGEYGFVPTHFYLPEELEEECIKANLKVLEKVGLEGLVTGHVKASNELAERKPELWEKWKKIHLNLCTYPAVVGISEHFMIICKKYKNN